MAEKSKISGGFKNSTSIVQQCQNRSSFQRKGCGIVLKFSLNFLKGRKYFLMNRKSCKPFKKNLWKILIRSKTLKLNAKMSMLRSFCEGTLLN